MDDTITYRLLDDDIEWIVLIKWVEAKLPVHLRQPYAGTPIAHALLAGYGWTVPADVLRPDDLLGGAIGREAP